MKLNDLAAELRAAPAIALKRDIQSAARELGAFGMHGIRNGDDAAAIPDGDGYTLLAAEGMLPGFVAHDPWFAGFCAVMVNVSDIAAMGGTASAVVNVLFAGEGAHATHVLRGMRAAAEAFDVPVVGGHTSRLAAESTLLAAAIVGKAQRLITSFDAEPGDALLMAVDLRGEYRDRGDYFDAASAAPPARLRENLRILPELAEAGLVKAGKDISMAGIAGTLLMLCEGSGVGAHLALDALPSPALTSLERWLVTFPSFGFLLTSKPAFASEIEARFAAQGVACQQVGSIEPGARVTLTHGDSEALFWDLSSAQLTGFGANARETSAP